MYQYQRKIVLASREGVSFATFYYVSFGWQGSVDHEGEPARKNAHEPTSHEMLRCAPAGFTALRLAELDVDVEPRW